VDLPRITNDSGPSLATVSKDGALTPFPDMSWNSWTDADTRAVLKAAQAKSGPPKADPKAEQATPARHAGGDAKPKDVGSATGRGTTAMPASSQPAPPAASPAPPPAPTPGTAFIGLNAVHLAPDGSLWAVDTGTPGFGKPPLPGGTKLVRIDLKTNKVTRVLVLPQDVLRPKSMIDDIRFNGGRAYITDAGAPGLIVLDLASGNFRRVLDGDAALTAQRPTLVDGEMLRGPDGKPVMIHADQLEVTPDGQWLFVQPLCGPMVRIPTALIDDPNVPARVLSAAVQFWYDTPALGGTAITRDGTLLLLDLENDSLLSLSPDRTLTLLLQDPRLHWADAPFLSPDGTLFVPVPQLDRAAPFHHGHTQIRYPVMLFSLNPAALAAGAKARAQAAADARAKAQAAQEAAAQAAAQQAAQQSSHDATAPAQAATPPSAAPQPPPAQAPAGKPSRSGGKPPEPEAAQREPGTGGARGGSGSAPKHDADQPLPAPSSRRPGPSL